MHGLFLSLDGLDGCGKSTQSALTCEWLRSLNRDVVFCSDPGGTAVGTRIRDILLHQHDDMALSCEALLFMASRAQLVNEIIRPALEAGKIVLSDRFLLANVVYQGHAGGLKVADLWHIGQFATGGLEPDLTIVLDLPVEAAVIRRGSKADRIEQREGGYHERVRQGFLTEADRRPERIKVVNAQRSVDEVQQQIRSYLQPLLP